MAGSPAGASAGGHGPYGPFSFLQQLKDIHFPESKSTSTIDLVVSLTYQATDVFGGAEAQFGILAGSSPLEPWKTYPGGKVTWPATGPAIENDLAVTAAAIPDSYTLFFYTYGTNWFVPQENISGTITVTRTTTTGAAPNQQTETEKFTFTLPDDVAPYGNPDGTQTSLGWIWQPSVGNPEGFTRFNGAHGAGVEGPPWFAAWSMSFDFTKKTVGISGGTLYNGQP